MAAAWGALVALAGCGGSDDPAAGALTETEFRSQANALCADADEEVEEIARGVAENVTDDVGEAMIRSMIDQMREMLEELEALEPPSSLRARVEQLLEDARTGLRTVDEAEFTELETMENPFAAAGTRADELGLDDCVEFLA